MWPFKKRRRVRSEVKGKVVSVKPGARTRVTVETEDGTKRMYFCKTTTIKVDRKVRPSTTLGYLE